MSEPSEAKRIADEIDLMIAQTPGWEVPACILDARHELLRLGGDRLLRWEFNTDLAPLTADWACGYYMLTEDRDRHADSRTGTWSAEFIHDDECIPILGNASLSECMAACEDNARCAVASGDGGNL